jgi:hypothetical protein
MQYTEPAVVTTYKATSAIQMQSGDKRGGAPDTDNGLTNNPAYEGDE